MAQTVIIAGVSRSGSTVLGMLLGAMPGWVFVGESRKFAHVWRHSDLFKCGCGLPVRGCPFWGEVTTSAGIDPAGLLQDSSSYTAAVASLFGEVRAVSGARFLVDSSKEPGYVKRLAATPGVNARIVHIVRDPRGHVASRHAGWRGRNAPTGPPSIGTLVRVALHWQRVNRGCEPLPATSVRYEDLAVDPARVVSSLGAQLGMETSFTQNVGVQHIVGGNPARFTTGLLQVSLDQRWQLLLPRWQQFLTYLLGLPRTHRYHYRAIHRKY